MRVAINAWSLNSPHTGIASYTRNLAMALRDLGEAELMLFYGFSWSQTLRESPIPGMGTMKALVKRMLPAPYALTHAVRQIRFMQGAARLRPELYHEPGFLPFRFPGPTVITVHDLSPLRYPDTHPSDRVEDLNKRLPAAIAGASAVIVDSEFIRQEVIGHFGADPARVIAIHLGVSREFRPRPEPEISSMLKKHSLSYQNYVLAVGTLEPRKNLIQAIDAYVGLPEAIRKSTPLVIAGMKGWLSGQIEVRIRKHEDRGELRWLGYVPAETLPLLYSAARMLVYPSIYEGFGLPVLEAMASGIPVITSNRASLPEVAGDVGLAVDPENVEGLRAYMRSLIEDKEEAARRGALGIARARLFTWQTCAQQTLAVYEMAIDGHSRQQQALRPEPGQAGSSAVLRS
jgi:alpha-1,3-rhamnosyl/mannosyltransferase